MSWYGRCSKSGTFAAFLLIGGMLLLTLLLPLAPGSGAVAAGIAGPNQTIAEGLVVLLGDPDTSGTPRRQATPTIGGRSS